MKINGNEEKGIVKNVKTDSIDKKVKLNQSITLNLSDNLFNRGNISDKDLPLLKKL